MGSGLEAMVFRLAVVGARVSALMLFVPFLAGATIAPRIKAGFTAVLTALLYPVVAANLATLSAARAWQMVGGEFVIGLIMGITLQFVFEGVQLAGQIVGFQVGHSLANLINPLTDIETTVLSNFYQAVALLIFLQLEVHHLLPPGNCCGDPCRGSGGLARRRGHADCRGTDRHTDAAGDHSH
jgi:flagellar biosynthetic protein FliR